MAFTLPSCSICPCKSFNGRKALSGVICEAASWKEPKSSALTMAAMVLMAELRRTADGDDPAWTHGVFRNITSTYSVIDEGGGADRDRFMRMRMLFARMDDFHFRNTDFGS